jgi:hypothetical protein
MNLLSVEQALDRILSISTPKTNLFHSPIRQRLAVDIVAG